MSVVHDTLIFDSSKKCIYRLVFFENALAIGEVGVVSGNYLYTLPTGKQIRIPNIIKTKNSGEAQRANPYHRVIGVATEAYAATSVGYLLALGRTQVKVDAGGATDADFLILSANTTGSARADPWATFTSPPAYFGITLTSRTGAGLVDSFVFPWRYHA